MRFHEAMFNGWTPTLNRKSILKQRLAAGGQRPGKTSEEYSMEKSANREPETANDIAPKKCPRAKRLAKTHEEYHKVNTWWIWEITVRFHMDIWIQRGIGCTRERFL